MKRLLSRLAPLLMILAFVGCGPAAVVDKKMVQMNYKGTLPDGTVFGQSEAGKPIEFMIGAGKMIPALEKGIMGLKVGAKKKIEIKAADAYGEYDKNAVQEVPKEQFPKLISSSPWARCTGSSHRRDRSPSRSLPSRTRLSPWTSTIRWPAKTSRSISRS